MNSRDAVEVQFDIHVVGQGHEDALLDEFEVQMLLENTMAHLEQHVQDRLAGQICEEHGQAPKVLISGTYSLEDEQLDVSYNVEACCNPMIMRSIGLLTR
jgi:hypothetical protein